MDATESNKKARIGRGDEVLSLPSIRDDRFSTIRRWIAKPIDVFRDENGVFQDPHPASILVPKYHTLDREGNSIEDLENTGVLIGNKYHASDVDMLVKLGVTAVLNCASGGISRLPVDTLRENGIRYAFTNVQQDDLKYPILHELPSKTNPNNKSDPTINSLENEVSPPPLVASRHLKVAKAMYIQEVLQKKGKLLFFCVAGQNRSATLALAILLLRGKPNYTMDTLCASLSKTRPFILENEGFQRQLLELEEYLDQSQGRKKKFYGKAGERDFSMTMHTHGDYTTEDQNMHKNQHYLLTALSYDTVDDSTHSDRQHSIHNQSETSSTLESLSSNPLMKDTHHRDSVVEVELLIPGLCTMEVFIRVPSSISDVKDRLTDHVNRYLLKSEQRQVAKSWVVLATFGKDDMYDFPLEDEAIERSVQWDRLRHMFRLKIDKDHIDEDKTLVHWNSKCRFALVIFSVYCNDDEESKLLNERRQVPWTFLHRERPGAPATLLNNTLASTHLRAWDFCDGQAFSSKEPIVFSFSDDSRDKRQFMKISRSAQEAQQFHAPGEGGILGMGANAIVHRVELKSTSPKSVDNALDEIDESGREEWDAAVKRPFSLSKMLASLQSGSEAGLGKRLRQLSNRTLLNSDGRVLYFYGLGVALSSNAHQSTEYKFEAVILARYEEEFSTYTMKRFMQDYTSRENPPLRYGDEENESDWRKGFSLISVKVLLVSLLNAFRDLTLMGVQAFDFNHLGNVLISKDHQSVKLLDIDGDSRGSIPLSKYTTPEVTEPSSPRPGGLRRRPSIVLHKPSLDIDLNAVLPTVVQQLLLGKAKGVSFVVNTKSEIWRLPPSKAKALVEQVVADNFGPLTPSHMAKVVEWFYAMLKKQPPWGNWTHDIYDAMRCIDHLPIR